MESQDKPCWDYLERNSKTIPVLEIVIVGPLQPGQGEGEIPVPIDTGYEGFLLLSEERYRLLGLNLSELPRRYWPEAETITGEVFKLRRASAIVRVPDAGKEFEGYIETFQGNSEDLLGLDFLSNLNLLLEGPSERACLL